MPTTFLASSTQLSAKRDCRCDLKAIRKTACTVPPCGPFLRPTVAPDTTAINRARPSDLTRSLINTDPVQRSAAVRTPLAFYFPIYRGQNNNEHTNVTKIIGTVHATPFSFHRSSVSFHPSRSQRAVVPAGVAATPTLLRNLHLASGESAIYV